jgi:hypothetical protein
VDEFPGLICYRPGGLSSVSLPEVQYLGEAGRLVGGRLVGVRRRRKAGHAVRMIDAHRHRGRHRAGRHAADIRVVRAHGEVRDKYIEQNPAVMLGKPVIRGTRITVENPRARTTGYTMIGKLFGRTTAATKKPRDSLDPERCASHAFTHGGQRY